MLSICFLNSYRATEKLSVIIHFVIRQLILCKTHATPLTAHSGEEAEWGLAEPWPLCSQPSLHVNTTGLECCWNLGLGASLWGEREGAAALCDGLSYRAYLAHLKPGNLLRLQRGSPGNLKGSGGWRGAARQLFLSAESSRGCHMFTSNTMPTHLALAVVWGKADSKHIWPLFLLQNAAIHMQKYHVLLNLW